MEIYIDGEIRWKKIVIPAMYIHGCNEEGTKVNSSASTGTKSWVHNKIRFHGK
ncbi:hypothetical protein HZY62_19945 [Maribacter polysiphoniae]|uniref:Uncharacterized protein n=1 Tax=Maribacter polysiphoniae TaxID=429344 RepID=A0A316DPN4_9FLAO|nr:hypothetical protein [Maribacter polysiphoniae]MBD1262879.1 hypothetical protein [Maribacter polysiphoniae]PWK20197.1 hypothetical protein LX92_04140 [Maribacter polysiphoniae]